MYIWQTFNEKKPLDGLSFDKNQISCQNSKMDF
jgi:hypothetical protein